MKYECNLLHASANEANAVEQMVARLLIIIRVHSSRVREAGILFHENYREGSGFSFDI